jgi:rod shape-determining protein MreD
VKAAGGLVAIALALALQTTLDRFLESGAGGVDLVLVAGMLTGSLAGLLQDSFGIGPVGIGGLAKSIVGFLVGVVGQQFIVTAALPRLLMFLAATVVHSAVFMGLYVALDLRAFPPWTTIGLQALANAVAGVVAFTVIEAVPGVVDRRRMARRGRH